MPTGFIMTHAKVTFLFQATSKPHVESLRHQMVLARAHIIDNSPVWQMLKEMQLC